MNISLKSNVLACMLAWVWFLTPAVGQPKTENPFLSRDYWSTHPSVESIEQNIAKGYSIFQANTHGFDPTTYAIFANNPLSTIEYLIDKGNSVNKLTHDSRNYIFWAVSRGNLDLMKLLVKKGSKTDLRDSHQFNLLLFAAATGQTDKAIYEYCIALGGDPQNDVDEDGKNVLLVTASRMKDTAMMDYWVSKGVSLKSTDAKGNGLFSYAARSGDVSLLQQLKAKGVSHKKNKKTGENAFLFASKNAKNTIEFYQYLESLKLDPNVTDTEGNTPLHHLAYSCENEEIYDYFLSKGVNANTANSEGNLPIHHAAGRNKLQMVRFLAQKTNQLNAANAAGQTPLMIAVERNSPEVISYLLDQGADTNTTDKAGHTLGYYLIKSYRDVASFEQKLNLLTKKGYDPGHLQQDKSTLWHLAVEKNSVPLLEIINTLGLDINARDDQGNTALHYAAMKANHTDVLRYLISKGADIRTKTEFEETAYQLARENELLQKAGVNLDFLK